MEIIGSEQAGFRSGYLTVDHIFVLNSVLDFYMFCKKRLYACFIDYKKGFWLNSETTAVDEALYSLNTREIF